MGPFDVSIVEVKESCLWARTWYVRVVFVPLEALVVPEVMKNWGCGVSLVIAVPTVVELFVSSQRKNFPVTTQ